MVIYCMNSSMLYGYALEAFLFDVVKILIGWIQDLVFIINVV